MRPALGSLCLIIMVFCYSMVVDAMYQEGIEKVKVAHANSIRAGCYVTMYIVNKGALHGFLYQPPNNREDLKEVENRFHVVLPGRKKLIADLHTLHILPNDQLTESRYFIDTGNAYILSGAFIGVKPDNPARVMVVLDFSENGPMHITLYSGINSFERHFPDWVNRDHNFQNGLNQPIIRDEQQHFVPDASYSNGGDNNGRHDNYHIKEGCYVTLFIVNDGAYRGYLTSKPNRQYHVDYSLFVRVSKTMTFFAEMKRFPIRLDEFLMENRYYIQIGRNFVVSTLLKPHNVQHDDKVILEMRYFENPNSCITVYGGLGYYKGRIPAWTFQNYRGPAKGAPQLIASSSSSNK